MYRQKGPDWYWALGVIALASAVIAVIYNNIFFAVFIILGAIVLGFYANKRPEVIDVAISEEGVMVQNYLYPFETLKGFAVDQHELGTYLLIETSRTLVPVVSIPLPEQLDPDALSDLLKTRVEPKKLEEPLSHKLMEVLGF